MSQRVFLASSFVAVFALSCVALLSGADWLNTPLLQAFPLPLGNLVAGFLCVSLAALPVLATRPGTLSRIVAWLLLAAAVLWLPVSIGLAGNLELNFPSRRGDLWLWYSLAVPGASLLLLLSRLVRYVLHRWKHETGPEQPAFVTGDRP